LFRIMADPLFQSSDDFARVDLYISLEVAGLLQFEWGFYVQQGTVVGLSQAEAGYNLGSSAKCKLHVPVGEASRCSKEVYEDAAACDIPIRGHPYDLASA